MTRLVFASFFACVAAICHAQNAHDSLRGIQVVHSEADSISSTLARIPDTIQHVYLRVESIRSKFKTRADSLQHEYKQESSRINDQINHLIRKADSVRRLNPRSNKLRKYERSMDKLAKLNDKLERRFTQRFNSLKKATIDELLALDLPNQFKDPLKSLTHHVENLNFNTPNLELPNFKIPGYNLPDIGSVPNLATTPPSLSTPDLTHVPEISLPNETPDFAGVQHKVNDVAGSAALPASTDQLQKTIESRASQIEGMSEVSKQSGVIENYKSQFEGLSDPGSAKEQAATKAKSAVVNHFEGKEEKLKAAMNELAKYKSKYSSLPSIRDLPKRPPNPMKEKPFIERLVPGLSLQYQQKLYYLLDLNPYVGYRLSGRLTAGLGWNHRIAWDHRQKTWNERVRIYGPRAYMDFKLDKGFMARIEGESMNSFVPSAINGNPDAGRREWVWDCMTGLKKEYIIYKNLKGTALIQYNILNRDHKAPYVDRFNSRIGFEYAIKKKR